MIERTQTSLYPEGNCWQTCIASILDIDPEVMPSQADLERPKGGYYLGALNAYLRKHHGLIYNCMHAHEVTPFKIIDPGWHMLEGETVRTPITGAQHVVVGRHGEFAWDPHPSRAGLSKVLRHSFLVPFPEDLWGDKWGRVCCVCPACTVRK